MGYSISVILLFHFHFFMLYISFYLYTLYLECASCEMVHVFFILYFSISLPSTSSVCKADGLHGPGLCILRISCLIQFSRAMGVKPHCLPLNNERLILPDREARQACLLLSLLNVILLTRMTKGYWTYCVGVGWLVLPYLWGPHPWSPLDLQRLTGFWWPNCLNSCF